MLKFYSHKNPNLTTKLWISANNTHSNYRINKIHLIILGGFAFYLVDPSRIELLSKLGIDPPLIHRFSLFYPQGGERSLSRTVGCSGKVFATKSARGNLLAHPLGFASSP